MMDAVVLASCSHEMAPGSAVSVNYFAAGRKSCSDGINS